MSDSNHTTMTVEAAFADAAQAERAVVQLQEHGVAPEQIDVEHGHTAGPGRTAAQDEGTVTRLAGSWWSGVLLGALVGGLLGALIGALTFGAGTPGFWALSLGAGGGGAGLGALYGMFAGFAGRSDRTRRYNEHRPPQLTDAVRVLVSVEPEQLDTARRIIRDKGGTL